MKDLTEKAADICQLIIDVGGALTGGSQNPLSRYGRRSNHCVGAYSRRMEVGNAG